MATIGPRIVPAYAPTSDAIQQAAIERQRKIADALMVDSMQPLQMPQQGRIASPVSPLAALAKVAQAGIGAYSAKQADERTAKLSEALRQRQNDALGMIMRGPQPNAPGGITQGTQPATPGDITTSEPQPQVKPFNDQPIGAGAALPGPIPERPAPQWGPDGTVPPGMATTEDSNGAQLLGHADDIDNIKRMVSGQTQISQPVGIVGSASGLGAPGAPGAAPNALGSPPQLAPKQRGESAAEFAQRVRIIADQFGLDPNQMMAMPQNAGPYQLKLKDEEQQQKFGYDQQMEAVRLEKQLAIEEEKRKAGKDDIVSTHEKKDGTLIGRKRDGSVVDLTKLGVDPNHLLLPDGTINQPYMDAQMKLAKERAINVGVNNFPNPIAVTDPVTGQVKMVQFGNKGDTREVPYLPAEQTKPTDTERMAKGYFDRMTASEKILQATEKAGRPTVGTAVAGSVPLVGAYLQRSSMTQEQQKYRQAQEDWVRAKLRKESGAVIGEDEMAREITTYFPQPGDGPQVTAQKGEARAIAIQAMRDAGGPAVPKDPSRSQGSGGPVSGDGWKIEKVQ